MRVPGTDQEASAREQEVLAWQLAMNTESWQALKEHGVTDESELRLDFFYAAPDEKSAKSLMLFIRDQTDYDVEAASHKAGLLKKRDWTVTGSTQATPVSKEILDQWVGWMVAAGFEHGCEFDGWGAETP